MGQAPQEVLQAEAQKMTFKTKDMARQWAATRWTVRLLGVVLGIATKQLTGVEMVITSVTGDKHAADSFHYEGRAFDFRSKHYSPEQRGEVFTLASFLAQIVGGKVLLEVPGKPNEHFHIQV
jgi:hypothetical protein